MCGRYREQKRKSESSATQQKQRLLGRVIAGH